MPDKIRKSESEWREQLSPEQFAVCRRKGTEPAFSGEYHATKEDGIYVCVCCESELFDAQAKYDSGSGWPSFWEPAGEQRVRMEEDASLGMLRIEVLCARCDAHLGHVFPDGPEPSGQRYCMNSLALELRPRREEESG
jgi:peptide-methionine (R)-S-oxide reductase